MWTRVSWVLSVTEHPGLSFTPCAMWEHSVSLGHMSNARHEKIFPWGSQNYMNLLSGYQNISSCFLCCLIDSASQECLSFQWPQSFPLLVNPVSEAAPLFLDNDTKGLYNISVQISEGPVLVCQSWHPALSIPGTHWCAWCYMVQAPGVPAGMGGMYPLDGGVRHSCFTRCFALQVRLAPLGFWSSRNVLW